jgi:hypothetical protein
MESRKIWQVKMLGLYIPTLTADLEMMEHVRKIVDLVSQAFGLCATGTNKILPPFIDQESHEVGRDDPLARLSLLTFLIPLGEN